MAYVNLSHMPNPKQEYVVNLANLDGGLNLSELEYRLKNDESPDMKNLLWREGVLCSRDGQVWVNKEMQSQGVGYAMYPKLFNGFLVAHIGTGLYYLNPDDEEPDWTQIVSGVPENNGSFFLYFDSLYYKNVGGYFQIDFDYQTETLSGASVTGYVPIIVVNASPSTGSGDLYQPENRISARKTVWYNAVSGVSAYQLPVHPVDAVTEVKVDGAVLVEGTDYTVDRANGVVNFTNAPPVTNPPTNNTVVITYSVANTEASSSIMDCPYAVTYGGTGDLCVVMGGCPAQPNAIFWNGNNIAMDPTYFPMDQYQFCGNTDDMITGFGKQQSFLVVFKTHSVGRVKQDTQTVDGRLTIDMPFVAINDKIGCDCPGSIQLIDNNLVWCNTEQGVHLLKDSSYAYENNIECISRKINGGPTKRGMLDSVRNSVPVSFDDSKRYWLNCGDEVWVWDYENSDYKTPSWYYLTDIEAKAYASEYDRVWHLNEDGLLTIFTRGYTDYDGPIEKKYRFASQFFGGYDRLKNVNSVIVVIRPDTNSSADLTYITDYETRKEITPLTHVCWQLVPRDLSYRSLAGIGFGAAFRRRPMCRRVQHFTMQLENNVAGQDMNIVSAQIFYNFQGRLR